MKKYTKPTVEIVELSVKESLSALPSAFKGVAGKTFTFKLGTAKNVSIYSQTSAVEPKSIS